MARYTATTTERGLGAGHQRDRITALTQLRDGQPCARCGGPMYRSAVYWVGGKPRSRTLDLDHFPGRMYGGPQITRLAHRSCNRRSGQRQTTAILKAKGRPLTRRQLLAIRAKQANSSGKTVPAYARQTVPAYARQPPYGGQPSGRW
jgi:hypothetical protein